MTHGRRRLGICAAVAAAVMLADMPAPAGQSQAVFKSAAKLVLQNVVVRDKDGRPMPSLRPEDFKIVENGVPQQVAFAEYQRLDASVNAEIKSIPAVINTAPAPLTSVRAPRSGESPYRNRRLVVFYFDFTAMSLVDQARACGNATRFIDERMEPVDAVAIMAFDGRGVRLHQDFTDDRARLRSVIDGLLLMIEASASGESLTSAAGAFGENADEMSLFTTDRQLFALQQAAIALGTLGERKTLILFGGGLQFRGIDNQAQLRATINAAVRANVTLNPVDTRGLVATAPLGNATASPRGADLFSAAVASAIQTRREQSQDALYSLAKDTGGVATFDYNDLSLGVARAVQNLTDYYVIGYYSDNDAEDGRFRKVGISLANATGAKLSYRPGFYAPAAYAKLSSGDRERLLQEAFSLENMITDIPIAAAIHYFKLSAAEYFVPVSVRMPWDDLVGRGQTRGDIDVVAEVKDEFGVTHQNLRDRLRLNPGDAAASISGRPVQYETGFTVLPGKYVVKLLARDSRTGRIGTFVTTFAVPNLEREKDRLPVSSLVLSAQKTNQADVLYNAKGRPDADRGNPLRTPQGTLAPSVTNTFSSRRPLFAYLQAYRSASEPARGYGAFVALYDGQRNKVFETPLISVNAAPLPKSGAVPIEITVDLSGVPEGRYTCQFSVIDPSTGRTAFARSSVNVVR